MKWEMVLPGSRTRVVTLLMVGVIALAAAGCGQLAIQAGDTEVHESDGLPANIVGTLQPGLATVYFFEKFRSIDDMPKSERGIDKFGQQGSPIFKLDHRFGDGEVFDSGRSQKVGILMRGFMQLDKPGTYLFQARSNDGFEMAIDGQTVVSDPTVHRDRLSDPGSFKVIRGGYFPVEIRYFQRKGTATLELYWQPPDAAAYSIVPAEVYVHAPGS